MRLKITGSRGRKEVNASYCCCQLKAVLNTCKKKKYAFLKCTWEELCGVYVKHRIVFGECSVQ